VGLRIIGVNPKSASVKLTASPDRRRSVEQSRQLPCSRQSLPNLVTSGLPVTRPSIYEVVFSIPEKCGNCQSLLLHAHRQVPGWANTNQMHRRERGPGGAALSSAAKLAVARVSKRPKDDAGVFIDGVPKIHGEGENNDKEEEIDAKQRMQ